MSKPLTACGIVITRPQQQALALAEMVRQAGGEPLLCPLLEIVGLDDYTAFDAVAADLDTFDWAIFISSNAVQHGMQRLLAHRALPAELKWAAIGPMTAQELQGFGVEQILTPTERFDSESLLKLPEMKAVKGQRFVIFRGVGGRDVLAAQLIKRGAEVVFAESYRRISPPLDITQLHGLWQNGHLHAIVVTSSEALRYLLEYVEANPWLMEVTVFVNHARIAENAIKHGFQAIVAQDLGDEGMLQALVAWHEISGK
ncbi:MAG TPA: uroporphyrinogen-III synthase [Methylophilaceae bacterium]